MTNLLPRAGLLTLALCALLQLPATDARAGATVLAYAAPRPVAPAPDRPGERAEDGRQQTHAPPRA